MKLGPRTIIGIVFIAAGIALFFGNREAEDTEDIPPIEAITSPVVFDPPEYELGTIGMGETHSAPLTLVNRGDDVMKIIAARSSCSCSSLPEDLVGKEIKPSETLTVPVKIDTGDHPQQLASDIILRVESTTRSDQLFVIRGTVLSDIVQQAADSD